MPASDIGPQRARHLRLPRHFPARGGPHRWHPRQARQQAVHGGGCSRGRQEGGRAKSGSQAVRKEVSQAVRQFLVRQADKQLGSSVRQTVR